LPIFHGADALEGVALDRGSQGSFLAWPAKAAWVVKANNVRVPIVFFIKLDRGIRLAVT
jgi:hypothetical protein